MYRKCVGLSLLILFLIVALNISHLAGKDMAIQPVTALQPVNDLVNPTGFTRGHTLPGIDYPASLSTNTPFAGVAPNDPPAGFDLDVTFINRSPMYHAYCVTYTGGIPSLCSGTESEKRWPDPGEIVTFTAHVVNKGTLTSSGFTYRWFIDDVEVHSGSASGLAAGVETTFTYQWTWDHTLAGEQVIGDHRLRFSVEPIDPTDTYPGNNSLEDRTNALGFHIAITPDMVAAYNTPWNPSFSYSAEDWLQRQIAAMNTVLEQSVYPATPQGATERVRINHIEVTATPPLNDGSHDGGWFVNADYRVVSGGYDPVVDVDWNLVHELSHQIGLIDLYNLDMPATSVNVLDNDGLPANFGFKWPNDGIMGGGDIAPYTDHNLYSSHSAAAISSNKGYRRGYYGEYQYDLPEQIDLLVLDNQGNPANGVDIALYQRTGPADWIGVLSIDNTPDISGVTGADGRFTLTNQSANGGITTRTGHVLADNPFGVIDVIGRQTRFLIKLGQGEQEEFHWLDITGLNLAYWLGDTTQHTIILNSHVPPASASEPPLLTHVQVEGEQATICWQTQPGTTYNLYAAGPPVYAYEQVAGALNGPCTTHTWIDSGWGGNRVYALTAVTTGSIESGFSNFVWAPRLRNPTTVALDRDGRRIILDRQNGYALLRQDGSGWYRQNFGSPHFHLEYSRYFTVDEDGSLIFSHPGDYYSSRHSVRVAGSDATPLLEFGEQGSGPGQFQTPAGVAVWGEPCTFEGPYTDDAHTLLLLHLDGSYEGTQGEVGVAVPSSFTDGRYGQGALILQDHTLQYASAGNINRTEGAIEFWLRPEWNGDDGLSHTFFEIGNTWFNRMRIMKDGANNFRFLIWDSATEYGLGYNVADWLAGEWHHVAVTWSGSDAALFVDGQQVAVRHDIQPPDALGATIYIGSDYSGNQEAEATIDELRISDNPRLGNSDTCSFRFLVADRDNHRLQAFDELGTFVAEFGEYGSGPGQFNQPRGLAIDGQGRVLVADSGNHRLQRLSFDGSAFGFVDLITANFNQPYDVTVAGNGYIIVADTGNNLIKLLDGDGVLLDTYDAPNDGYAGTFLSPEGVGVEPPGNIIVADTGRQRVVTIREALPLFKVYLPTIYRGDG